MDPTTAAQFASPQQWWQYGVLGVGVVIFAVVIVFLFKKYEAQTKVVENERKAMADERLAWAIERERWGIERERIRAEFETRHANLVTEYAKQVNADHDVCQEREDAIREEFDKLTQLRSDEQKRAMDALVESLGKLGDKLTPVSGRRGY